MRKFLVALFVFASLLVQAQVPNGSQGIASSVVVGPEDHPGWTTAGRPPGITGRSGWNLDSLKFEVFYSGAWHSVGGAGGIGPAGPAGTLSRFGLEDAGWTTPKVSNIPRIFNIKGAGDLEIRNVFPSGGPSHTLFVYSADSVSPSQVGGFGQMLIDQIGDALNISASEPLFNVYYSNNMGSFGQDIGAGVEVNLANDFNAHTSIRASKIFSYVVDPIAGDSSGFYMTSKNIQLAQFGRGLKPSGSGPRGIANYMLAVDGSGNLVEVSRQGVFWYQQAMVSGVASHTVIGTTSSSMVFAQLVSQSGAANTAAVKAEVIGNNVFVRALTNAGNNTVNTADNSIYNIWIIP